MFRFSRLHRPVVALVLFLAVLLLAGVGGCGNGEKAAGVRSETPAAAHSEGPPAATPTPSHEVGLYIFILAGFLGYHVISRVPPLLHTPLMSATNAISGISLIGSLVVAGTGYGPQQNEFLTLSTILGFIAVACSSTNVVGGFLITDRMLAMFKSERDAKEGGWLSEGRFVVLGSALLAAGTTVFWWGRSTGAIHPNEVLRYLYIVSAVLFILGLKGLSSPRSARRGMFLAEFGMAVAIIGTLFDERIKLAGYAWIGVGMLIGSVVGGTMGLRIPMTAVPQRTALSHALGALAATLVGVAE